VDVQCADRVQTVNVSANVQITHKLQIYRKQMSANEEAAHWHTAHGMAAVHIALSVGRHSEQE